MAKESKISLLDRSDKRGISLASVGIEGFISRTNIITGEKGEYQQVTANVGVYTNLSSDIRAIHPRSLEEIVLKLSQQSISDQYLMEIATMARNSFAQRERNVRERFNLQPWVKIALRFPLLFYKQSPVSKIVAPLNYDCQLITESNRRKTSLQKGVTVPVMTVCPDSLELSATGAHSQRSLVTIYANSSEVAFDKLIKLAESAGSSPVYSIISSDDDRYITDYSFAHPKLAEDVVRDTVLLLEDQRIPWGKVSCLSFESNRGHNIAATAVQRRST